MKPAKITHRPGGPTIEGTRISVYTILEHLRAGDGRDSIAAELLLSSAQVQAAMDYIREHQQEVNAEYERIMERIRKGNSPEALAKLEASRQKLQELLADPQKLAAWRAGLKASKGEALHAADSL